jgi:hypothetical protein
VDKFKALSLALLVVTTLGTIEWSYVDEGVLLGSIAYPDGAAVDITLSGNDLRFTAILQDGTRQPSTMSVVCATGIDSAIVTANGRAVHLVAQGDCGVEHYRYWIPGGVRDLKERQVFFPIINN